MNSTIFKEKFDQLQLLEKDSSLGNTRKEAFATFTNMGIPNAKHEEWKYTRIGGLFNKDFQWDLQPGTLGPETQELHASRMPGHEKSNTLVFLNGIYAPALSVIRSAHLRVLPLEEAAKGEHASFIRRHLSNCSRYQKDGVMALSTAFLHGGMFAYLGRGQQLDLPVYIYYLTDARVNQRFSQPRSLVFLDQGSHMQVVETFVTQGTHETLSNHVTELIVEKDAMAEYYKIQDDRHSSNLVSTTHVRQIGKSYTHSVVITLNGGIVRNNLNTVLEADHCETHLYGLYCLQGDTHVDNHTLVDNVSPHCFSNELYKGMVDGQAAAVFNGKIFVRKDAQKTNAYQSNKNILISDQASVNSKPQLEIFADDVKCSHGCTVGSLDPEALFYLRSRGLSKDSARSMLLRAFALDILENIKLPAIRSHVDRLISDRLTIEEI
jgi:Fe-S cluster assembly protein SufD